MTLLKDNPLENATAFPAHKQLVARPVWGPGLVPINFSDADEDSLAVMVARLAERDEYLSYKLNALLALNLPVDNSQYQTALNKITDLAGRYAQDKVLIDQRLADTAQALTLLQATAAGTAAYANLAAFPAASQNNGKAAWATDTGFIYLSNGATWNKTGEVSSPEAVQGSITSRLVADTLNALGTAAGRVNGDVRHIKGVPYQWDATSTRPADGIATIAAAATPVGRWLLPEADFGIHPKRAGAVCDGVTDDTAAVQATINLAAVLGTIVRLTGKIFMGAVTITTAVTILGQGATIIPNPDKVTGRGTLFFVDGTGRTIERVNILGLTSDGAGVRCCFLKVSASTTAAAGLVRYVNVSGNVIRNYWDQTFRFGGGQKNDGTQWVEDLQFLGNTVEDCGPLTRLNATGAAGSTALTFISADGRSIAGRVPIGAAFKLAGGGEIYRVVTCNAGTGAATITPALTRAVDRQYVFQVEETQPLVGGAAGSTALTLASASPTILVGGKITMTGVRGAYIVTAVNGTAVTLDKPLLDNANILFTRAFCGGAYCQGLYLDPYMRRATIDDNTMRNSTGTMLFHAPFTGDMNLMEGGEFVITNNRISYGYMLIESPTLDQEGRSGTLPTVTGVAGGTTLTVGNAVNLTTSGVGVGAVITMGAARGSYQVTAVTATTFTITRFDMGSRLPLPGGLIDTVSVACPIGVLLRADGIPGFAFSMPRLVMTGNVLSHPTRDDYGYCVSVGGETVIFSDNACTTYNRPVFEIVARNGTISNNPSTIRNYEGPGTPGFGVTAAANAQPAFAWGNISIGNAQILNNPVEWIPGTYTGQFWSFLNLYHQFGVGGYDLGGTISGNTLEGLQGAFINTTAICRYDGLMITHNRINAPKATGSIIQIQGTRWSIRHNDFYLPVGDGVPILRAPNVGVPVTADNDFSMNVVRTNRKVQAAGAGLVRTAYNTYFSNGSVVTYDSAYAAPDFNLEILKAINLLDNYVLGDTFNRADAATLGNSSSGTPYVKLTGVTGDFGVVGNRGSNATAVDATQGRNLAVVNGSVDGSIEAVVAGGGQFYIYGRTSDQYNFWRFGANSYSLDGVTALGQYYFMWRTGGAPTYIADISGIAKVGDRLKMEFKGTSVIAYLNGEVLAVATQTANQTATFFGINGKAAGANPSLFKSVIIRQG